MTNPTPARRGRRLAAALVVLLVVAAAFALRFQALGRAEPVASIREIQETEGVPVQVSTVAPRDLARWTTLAGTVEGNNQYPVVSNNALRVVGIPAREGDPVRAGDVIVRLADEAPSPMYHSVAEAQARYRQALADVRRLRNLFAEGAISAQQLDHAETDLAVAAATLADAEGSIALTASAAGTVTAILVEPGETVRTGVPLAWVARTDTVRVVFEAGSRQALALAPGQQAAWTDPDGRRRPGVLAQLDLMADPVSHLLEGEARFANPDGRLVPGLLVSFAVRTHHRDDVLAVPAESVRRDGDGAAVWVVEAHEGGALAVRRDVDLGLSTGDAVEITAGLRPGETVVRFGQAQLRDGVPVQVVDTGEEG